MTENFATTSPGVLVVANSGVSSVAQKRGRVDDEDGSRNGSGSHGCRQDGELMRAGGGGEILLGAITCDW